MDQGRPAGAEGIEAFDEPLARAAVGHRADGERPAQSSISLWPAEQRRIVGKLGERIWIVVQEAEQIPFRLGGRAIDFVHEPSYFAAELTGPEDHKRFHAATSRNRDDVFPGAQEFGHRGIRAVRHAFAAEDHENGLEENRQVERHAPVIDVPGVEPEFLLPREGVAPPHLAPAGDARLDFVTPSLLGRVTIEILRQEGPRADQAHLSPQHLQELRQFVEARLAKQAAERRQACRIGERPSVAAGGTGHRAKLPDRENSPAQPRAFLQKEDGPPEKQPHERRHAGHHGQQDSAQDRRSDEVDRSLEKTAPEGT